ncbi:MAG: hypothetical protein ACHQ01_06105 [Candidatus Limnocylindrales bacterium]
MWRRLAFRIGGLLTGVVSLLGFVWAWSAVPDSLGLGARAAAVGIIGALWIIVVVALFGRALLRVAPRPPDAEQAASGGVMPPGGAAPPLGTIERTLLGAAGLDRVQAPPGHGLDDTAIGLDLRRVACICGWRGSIQDYLTIHLPEAGRNQGSPTPPAE